jgi:hypothetical protein
VMRPYLRSWPAGSERWSRCERRCSDQEHRGRDLRHLWARGRDEDRSTASNPRPWS